MYCQNCGTELAAGTKFCSSCGTEQKYIFSDKSQSKITRKSKKTFVLIVVGFITVIATVCGMIVYNNNQLTIEEVREKFVEAQEMYKVWCFDTPTSATDKIEEGDFGIIYQKVIGDIDTREEISEILSEYFSAEASEELLDYNYLERNGKLYFCVEAPDTELTHTVVTEEKIYKNDDCWFYEINSNYYYSYDTSEVFENDPVVLKLVKDDDRWVFDNFSLYIALYEFK